jgi:hypothetical protein
MLPFSPNLDHFPAELMADDHRMLGNIRRDMPMLTSL